MADTSRPNDSTRFGEEPSSNFRVTGEWQVSLVMSEEWAVPLPARFIYRADDPYAVRLDFRLTTINPVRWVFARELLIAGVLRSVGQGDVRVWPTYEDVVCLCLDFRRGDVLLEIPGVPLNAWLERTYRAVPPGREHDYQPLDADAMLRCLTGETSPQRDGSRRPEPPGRPRTGTGDGSPEDAGRGDPP